MKTCNKCNEEKELTEFYVVRNKPNIYCKKCDNLKSKEYHIKNRDKILPRLRKRKFDNKNKNSVRFKVNELIKLINENQSVCTKCLKIKDKSCFITDNSRKNKLSASCKDCKNEYFRNKKKNDIKFKLICNLRSSLSESIKRNKLCKSYKTLDILGISIEDFKLFIESKFKDNMNWDNYGSYWEFDHIIQLATSTNEEELLKLNHYSNFQPLEVEKNRSKNYKY